MSRKTDTHCKRGHEYAAAGQTKRGDCKACQKVWRKAHYQANREAMIKKAAEWMRQNAPRHRAACQSWRNRNLDEVRVARRLRHGIINPPKEAPPGDCEICGKPAARLDCDHDHATGLFRGWLCRACNTGLGHIEKPGWLEKATAYLVAHQ